jgi:hypothetical protein
MFSGDSSDKPQLAGFGSAGMADMGSMEHPMPDNTLPMMTGFGQFGPIEMGGMFTLMKIREGLERNNYGDPSPYQHPAGTVAYEVKGAPSGPVRRSDNSATTRPGGTLKAVKPNSRTTPKPQH